MSKMHKGFLALLIFLSSAVGYPQTGADTLNLDRALIIKAPPGFPDDIARRDPLEAAIVTGSWTAPQEGQVIRYNDTASGTWEAIVAAPDGWYHHGALEGGYVYATVDCAEARVMLLEAFGNSMVYVNGVPRSGNPYATKDHYETWEPRFDYSLLPVNLTKGTNTFLFHCTRGALKARLIEPRGEVLLNTRDVTVPDLVTGRELDALGAVVVINASPTSLVNYVLDFSVTGGRTISSLVPPIQPYSLRKVGFRIVAEPQAESGAISGLLRLRSPIPAGSTRGNVRLDTASLVLRIVDPGTPRKETFVSSIDGSVQYYAIAPATRGERPAALFLSLHGAGVEAINQASSYGAKSWGHIVAPTNRRPYGFNWEDWGRADAMEVLALVKKKYQIDENRVYLTGHSMGGHGVYHIGSLFPDQFAAIGPSAGWLSFWSYRVREKIDHPSPVRQMLMRATLPSETLTFAKNFQQFGVYILHGSEDDNVPPEQSRIMAKHLGTFHKDFIYHEQQGAGHWWDNSDEPGADCVDWPPMFDFFARHARPSPEMVRQVDFITPGPQVSAGDYWVSIEAQTEQLKPSAVSLRYDPGVNRVIGTTSNVARLSLNPALMGANGPLSVEIDHQKFSALFPSGIRGLVWLARSDSIWRAATPPRDELKRPERYGTFKDLFYNKVVFVYGTAGDEQENAWAFDKSRFDAERFWYQGNGSIEVIADVDFRPLSYFENNIVLYGNATTNRAWKALLGGSPIQIKRGEVTFGKRTFRGTDLGCVLIRPRPGSVAACVGAVGGSGITGMRLTDRMPYLLPGVAFPDAIIARANLLSKGEAGIEAAGFFALDWSLEGGDFITGAK